jgi:hypothetical protein
MEAEVSGYRYRQPVDAVWPQVRRLLSDYGLTLVGKDAPPVGPATGLLQQLTSVGRETSSTPEGGLMLESDWTNGGRRWRAEAWPEGAGCRVTLTKIAENPSHRGHDDWSVRDYPLELELIRRVDPDGAARLDDLIDPPTTPGPSASPARNATPGAPAPGKTE